MERETINVRISSVKFAPTQNGKDKWNIGTSMGFMSCWDGDIAELLNEANGKTLDVHITRKDKYVNIVGICDIGESNQTPEQATPKAEVLGSVKTDRDINITAQCLTKCMFTVKAPESCETVMTAYKYFIKALS